MWRDVLPLLDIDVWREEATNASELNTVSVRSAGQSSNIYMQSYSILTDDVAFDVDADISKTSQM